MKLHLRVLRVLRLFTRHQHRVQYYYDKEDFSSRWDDVAQVVDLRPSDIVLDMGCAEGLISFEVAKYVRHVDGVEIAPYRVERAISHGRDKGIKNVSFKAGSVTNFDVLSKSYDVILFLGVMGKKTGGGVGLAELEKMLAATRRQIVVRANVQQRAYIDEDSDFRLRDILETMDRQGFDAICFDKRKEHGNLIVGNRRGSGGRLRSALPNVVIPTEMMGDHPCLRDVSIAAAARQDNVSDK